MKIFYLTGLVLSLGSAFAQQEYFTPDNKKVGLDYFKEKIYQGCKEPKKDQAAFSAKELDTLIKRTEAIVLESFSRAFNDNPKVKSSFLKDLQVLKENRRCLVVGNDCRVKLLSLSLYYYQQLRADIPDCKGYLKTSPLSDEYSSRCELELKYRKSSLVGVRNNYGMMGPGTYKKELIAHKNNTSIQLFNLIMRKENSKLHICNGSHQYNLNSDREGEHNKGLDPSLNPNEKISEQCSDEKVSLHSEFFMANFDTGRTTVGEDQIEPVRKKVFQFIKSHPDLIVTDVSVTSTSSKMPFYKKSGGRKIIDPESDKKNLSLATDRAIFATKVFNKFKASSSEFSHINFKISSELAGPEFGPMDLNDRFVTRMTPGYVQKLEALYRKNQVSYKEQALTSSPHDLLDEKKYSNLFQAKFKPFHGFRINILGHKKSDMNCRGSGADVKDSSSGSSKQ